MVTWSKILSLIGKISIVVLSVASFIAGIAFAVEAESILLFLLITLSGIIISIISVSFMMTIAEIGINIGAIRQMYERQSGIKIDNESSTTEQAHPKKYVGFGRYE